MSTPRSRSSKGRKSASLTALPLEVWGATDKGREREGNEDAIYPHSEAESTPFQPSPDRLAEKGQLLIVADGVGGVQAGAEASRWAVRVAVERYYDMPGPELGADLYTAVEAANASLYQYLQSTGMQEAGSTMTAAVIHKNMLYVVNVGDSRTYLLRSGQVTQLTRDHTLAQQKLDQGIIRPDQVLLDPDSSVLTRSLGAGPTVRIELFEPQPLAPGDVVLLCSDGLTDMLGDEEIMQLVKRTPLKRASQRLIALANKNGGLDNISVVMARVGGRVPPIGLGWLDSLRAMSRGRQIILAATVAAILLAFSGGLSLVGQWVQNQGSPTPTSLPANGSQIAPPTTLDATISPSPDMTSQATERATSTPAPSPTPTSTPTPIPTQPATAPAIPTGGPTQPSSPTDVPPTESPPTVPVPTDVPKPTEPPPG